MNQIDYFTVNLLTYKLWLKMKYGSDACVATAGLLKLDFRVFLRTFAHSCSFLQA